MLFQGDVAGTTMMFGIVQTSTTGVKSLAASNPWFANK